jgi:predicted nucleic acid-binding protein
VESGDACLLDSNILLRISKSDDLQHAAISHALHELVGQGVRLCYTSQTLAEFWNASTRPLDKNGFGLNVAETDRLARVIERDFEFLPDSREIHDRWRSLLVAHSIQGVQVHDPRLAASMYVHGVGQLLTINVRDFNVSRGCVFSIQPNSLGHDEHTTTALLGSKFDGNWESIARDRQ